jgi:hypothetical protein
MVNPAESSAHDAYSRRVSNTSGNVASVNTERYEPRETTSREPASGGNNAETTRTASTDRVDLSREAAAMTDANDGSQPSSPPPQTAQETQKLIIDIIA